MLPIEVVFSFIDDLAAMLKNIYQHLLDSFIRAYRNNPAALLKSGVLPCVDREGIDTFWQGGRFNLYVSHCIRRRLS